MNRFDSIRYDEISGTQATGALNLCKGIEDFINEQKLAGRSASVALTKLEDVHMWLGKAIRDTQVARTTPALGT